MTMTDEEIVSAAARLRAAKRRRVARTCDVCGTPFEGIAQRRYCSDACRVRASRARQGRGTISIQEEPPPKPRGEKEPPVDNLEQVDTYLMQGRVFTDSSAELVQERRMERTLELMRATGASEEELEHERAEWERDEERTLGRASVEQAEPMTTVNETDLTADGVQPMDDDPIRALLRERGFVKAEPEPPLAPRADSESSVEYLDRVRAYLMQGRVVTDSSADIIRASREERTNELVRAAGLEPETVG